MEGYKGEMKIPDLIYWHEDEFEKVSWYSDKIFRLRYYDGMPTMSLFVNGEWYENGFGNNFAEAKSDLEKRVKLKVISQRVTLQDIDNFLAGGQNENT